MSTLHTPIHIMTSRRTYHSAPNSCKALACSTYILRRRPARPALGARQSGPRPYSSSSKRCI